MSDVTRALPRLDPHHDLLRADGPEGVDHDFALDGLYRVDNHGDRSRVELFEGLQRGRNMGTSVSDFGEANPRMADLLSVDVDAGQPAAEAGMRVIPPDHHLWSGYMNGGSTSKRLGASTCSALWQLTARFA